MYNISKGPQRMSIGCDKSRVHSARRLMAANVLQRHLSGSLSTKILFRVCQCVSVSVWKSVKANSWSSCWSTATKCFHLSGCPRRSLTVRQLRALTASHTQTTPSRCAPFRCRRKLIVSPFPHSPPTWPLSPHNPRNFAHLSSTLHFTLRIFSSFIQFVVFSANHLTCVVACYYFFSSHCDARVTTLPKHLILNCVSFLHWIGI